MSNREIPITRKPTSAQLRALKRIALFPEGTFYQQFPSGADASMLRRMTDARWVTYVWTAGGYRLTDAGRTLLPSCQHNFDLGEGRGCTLCGFNPAPVQS